MGWLYTQGQSRKALIDRLTVTDYYITHKRATVGNVLWAVQEAKTGEYAGQPFIACYLLAPQKGYGWGYKDMCESMHPYYYSCPLAFLDMAPEASAEWREGVRQYHAKRAKVRSLKPGATFHLTSNFTPRGLFTLRSVKPLRATGPGGIIYRLKASAIDLDTVTT